MISFLKRVSHKLITTILLVIFLLTFLLSSDQHLPLIQNSLRGWEKGENINLTLGPNNIEQETEKPENITADSIYSLVPFNISIPLLNCPVSPSGDNTYINGSVRNEEGPNILIPKTLDKQNQKKPVKKILLLSSVGRSGSSFLGQLLASEGNNVYFYEPIRSKFKEYRYHDTTDELLRYFNCSIRSTVYQEGPICNIIVVHFPYVKRKGNLITPETVLQRCLVQPVVIIKTIRTRLRWVLARMQRNEFENVKVIHLLRDPRGSYTSMKKLRWKLSTKDMCGHLYEDLATKNIMMSLFPERYTFIKYEDLCLDPYNEARRLMRFIHDQEDEVLEAKHEQSHSTSTKDLAWGLPKGMRDYLQQHLHSEKLKRNFAYGTVRETSSMYQRWRWLIRQTDLSALETECRPVIKAIGHRLFNSFTAVRNASLSLFVDEN